MYLYVSFFSLNIYEYDYLYEYCLEYWVKLDPSHSRKETILSIKIRISTNFA
jgi:hypothetical protein